MKDNDEKLKRKLEEQDINTRFATFIDTLVEYLGVNKIPLVIEDIAEDARLYLKDHYIAISSKLIHDDTEILKILTHEYRHFYQYCYVDTDGNHPFAHKWSEELQGERNLEEQYGLVSELDAFSFSKFYLEKFCNIEIMVLSPEYDAICSSYIDKYIK